MGLKLVIIFLPPSLECVPACQDLAGNVLISGSLSWLHLLDDPWLLGISRNVSPSPKLSSVLLSSCPCGLPGSLFLCWSAAASVFYRSFFRVPYHQTLQFQGSRKSCPMWRFYAGWALGTNVVVLLQAQRWGHVDWTPRTREDSPATSYTTGFYSELF